MGRSEDHANLKFKFRFASIVVTHFRGLIELYFIKIWDNLAS